MDIKRRSILLGALIILIGFAVYFQAARTHVSDALLSEKVTAVENDVNYICAIFDFLTERDGAWSREKYQDVLAFATKQLDATPNIYAELLDEQFNTLSERIIPVDDRWRFDLKNYPDLIELLKKENSGKYHVGVRGSDGTVLNVQLYWRKMPDDSRLEDRVLLIAGISHYSVSTQLAKGFNYGIIALFSFSALFVACSIVLLVLGGKPKTENPVNETLS